MLVLLLLAIGFFSYFFIEKILFSNKRKSIELELFNLKKDAKREANKIIDEARILSKANILESRERFDKEVKNRRKGFENIEKRLFHKEEMLDKRLDSLNNRYDVLEKKEKNIDLIKNELIQKRLDLLDKINKQNQELRIISGLSHEDARQLLLERVENELKNEFGILVKNIINRTREIADIESKRIIALAIQRYASDFVCERTTNTIVLPNDEMKGRVIGRDGRNIRTLESVLGVNILIDDTPEAVVISCFDPVRREIAKQVMEKLIIDGRIHPGRVEEIAKKIKDNIDKDIISTGLDVILKTGLQNIDEYIVKLIGMLKFRYSFSQNVLQHSIETSYFMGMIASELNLDVKKAKKIGLFHDIGKAIDHEVEGSHASIGADILNKHDEKDPEVLNAVASHHGEIEPDNIYSILVSACDALSASRPGARSESTELYLKRLKQLENIAMEFEGVVSCFAFQAGRELRVVVTPDKVSDEMSYFIARDICNRVEKEVNYPGSIQVTVVRETRCIEYAK